FGAEGVVPVARPEGRELVDDLLAVFAAYAGHAFDADRVRLAHGGAEDGAHVPQVIVKRGAPVIQQEGERAALALERLEVEAEPAERAVQLGIVFAELHTAGQLQT